MGLCLLGWMTPPRLTTNHAFNGGTRVFGAEVDGHAGVLDAGLGGDVGVVDAEWLLAPKKLGGGSTGLPAKDALLARVDHVEEDAREGWPEVNFSAPSRRAK